MRSRDWDERWSDPDRPPPERVNAMFGKEAEALGPGRALDLACGGGRTAIWLARRGWRVTAVDFSEVALAAARRRAAAAGAEVEWIAADVLEWAPPAGAFDLVAMLYLQLPADERARALGRAAGALAEGGTLLVIAHDRENLPRGHGGPRDPEVLTTPEAVVADLPAGLRVERAERVVRPVAREDGTPAEALDTLVRASRPVSR